MSTMCPASKGTLVNWMKIIQEMPRLIACKSLLHVKYLWIWGNIHFLWAVIASLGRQHMLAVWSCSVVICVPQRQTQVLVQNLLKKWIWLWSLKLSIAAYWLRAHSCLHFRPRSGWKTHHGRKVGLKQTPLRGHHPSPWTSESVKLDPSPWLDKNTSVLQHGCVYTAWQQVVFR